MNRQEMLVHLKQVLSHDLNDDLTATALRTVLSVVMDSVRSIAVEPGEEWFLQRRDAVMATFQKVLIREVATAESSEWANRSKKNYEKTLKARTDYNHAVTAIEEPLRDIIEALERLN